ncbi:MAG: DNA translocase FtsK [Defluviitaleaceae bacterium]|nr:DNA translocase FtsK [Defluviitaleaceae bacterium]
MSSIAKTSQRRKKNTKTSNKNTSKKRWTAKSEARYLIIGAVGLLTALSVYIEGSVGFVGRFISGIFFGLFGFGTYLLPPAVIAIACYGLFSHKKAISSGLIAQALCLFWVIIGLVHIFAVPEHGDLGLWTYLQLLYVQGDGTNGGLLGGLLGNMLRSFLGVVGAYILLILGAIVTIVLITGRSFSQGITTIWEHIKSIWNYEEIIEDYDDEGYDDEYDTIDDVDDNFEEILDDDMMEAPFTRKLKPLPDRPERYAEKKNKFKDNVFDIREAVQRRDEKILLFHEEMNHNRHIKNKVLHFKTKTSDKVEYSKNESNDFITTEEDYIYTDSNDIDCADHKDKTEVAEDDLGITVKGLVISENPKIVNMEVFTEESTLKPKEAYKEPKIKAYEPQKVITLDTQRKYENYQFPPIDLLKKSQHNNPTESRTQLLENSRILEETLKSFKVEAKVIEVSVGPTVTRYDIAPGAGVKVATIANLSNDLALSLAAQGIRIEAPIPGKAAVGIEIPNKDPQSVYLRDILEDESFEKFPSALAFGIGKDIAGNPMVTDVAKMPHLLIAGATGAGKSVCINTLIASILYKSHPDEVKMIMIDPKVVELSIYNGIPHLLIPVVTDPKKASDALQWAVSEMEKRYERFATVGVRDLKGYNHHITYVEDDYYYEDENDFQANQTMPQIVIIIDELADLMMSCKNTVEDSICRLAQKARAAGIHMVLATQRPSVDVITGLIKANIPSRLAFAVSSGTDSRTVLDMTGAEKLLGKGDMLFLPTGKNKPIRLQGGFVSDKEVRSIVEFLKSQTVTVYSPELIEQVTSSTKRKTTDDNPDEFFYEAAELVIDKGKGSTGMLQRYFKIGYNRASRLMEELENGGIVGPEDGAKPRKILISLEEYLDEYGR